MPCKSLIIDSVDTSLVHSLPCSDFLRDAKAVSQLRKQQLTGDYARVLFKLSQALKRVQEYHAEAEDMIIEATALYQTMKKAPSRDPAGEDEQPWDDLVCILWR